MLTKKKKLSRKEIKEDKLVVSYYKARQYFEENQKVLVGIIAGVLIAAAAVYFYIDYKNDINREAGVALARAMDAYDSGNFLEAIEGRQGSTNSGLKKVVEEYGSTENGEAAKIYLANSYVMLGKLDDALNYYEDYSGSNEIYEATAAAGEAGYYAAKEDYAQAADLYKKAAKVSESNVLNPEYLLKAGINYMKAGNNGEAKAQFERIKSDYRTSLTVRDVDRYLAQVE